MSAELPLLAGMFGVPRPQATVVRHPGFKARLAQGPVVPLTLISPPSGSGETTLLFEPLALFLVHILAGLRPAILTRWAAAGRSAFRAPACGEPP